MIVGVWVVRVDPNGGERKGRAKEWKARLMQPLAHQLMKQIMMMIKHTYDPMDIIDRPSPDSSATRQLRIWLNVGTDTTATHDIHIAQPSAYINGHFAILLHSPCANENEVVPLDWEGCMAGPE